MITSGEAGLIAQVDDRFHSLKVFGIFSKVWVNQVGRNDVLHSISLSVDPLHIQQGQFVLLPESGKDLKSNLTRGPSQQRFMVWHG